ncbi:MAG TPA: hypothetical protein VG122_13730 [Gemmata sp.]|nr:hypothetical protein [Gemmata sp.]
MGLIVATGMVMAGHVVAQQPPPPIPVPPQEPQVGLPSIPTSPPVMPTSQAGPGSPVPFVSSGPGGFGQPVMVQRFKFKIDPNTPTKDLLPTPPSVKPVVGPVLTDDLTKIPEAEFQARTEKVAPNGKQTEQLAHQLAKINHVNAKKTDAFMTALLANREDLAGLPFAMGDDCRTSGERTKQFTQAVATVRQALGSQNFTVPQSTFTGPVTNFQVPVQQPNGVITTVAVTQPQATPPVMPSSNAVLVAAPPMAGVSNPSFWSQYATLCEQEDATRSRSDKVKSEHVTLARIAALIQMLAPESPELRLGLVKYLTAIPHVEATKALARIAIFSPEDDVRIAATDSLKVRREKDYTDILIKGLRYPWPAVAKRSAEAIARMGRSDLIPELVAVLAKDDPRMPTMKTEGGKQIAMVREMVKVNHHRNCMMCHAPGSPETVSSNAITAEVPVQGQPLPLPSEGYRQSSPDLMIRIDVTYLRQDFSAMLAVGDAHPWPEMQRFDFLVRERKLTSDEANEYKAKLTPKEAGVLSPYHRAALAALRELTGKDTAPTADAWQKLLDLPTTSPVKADESVKIRG